MDNEEIVKNLKQIAELCESDCPRMSREIDVVDRRY